ncbi:MAG: hypothetical protein EBS86_14715, partial [Crocinitomicaceae bacterium]|nr:hypothetical protein [Crocinitomicaceae bacterium]
MNIEEFNKQSDALKAEMAERMNEPKRELIYDGVMKPELYFNSPIRLAWMLKEPYDEENGTGGGYDYFDMFKEGEDLYLYKFKEQHKVTWHPMIYISHSIHNNFQKWEEMDYIRDNHGMCDVVRKVAFINSQKLPSKNFTHTDSAHLWESIEKNSDLLERQIKMLNPNVLIFGNTIQLYERLLNIEVGQFTKSGSCSYLIKDGKLYISAYHP